MSREESSAATYFEMTSVITWESAKLTRDQPTPQIAYSEK